MSNRHVITAAHCTDGNSPSGIKIAVGETSFALEGEAGESFIVNVKTIKQHPDYDQSTTQNDISVLELENPIDLRTHPNIKPICLPASGATFPNQEATVSGWGTLESGGVSPATLYKASVTVFEDGDCGVMNEYMTPDMLCAGIREGGKDSCQGDSGGPLVLPDPANNNAHTLVGVVSWGFGCAVAGQLGIYAEVSHFTAWLQEQMEEMESCPPPSSDPADTVVNCSPGSGLSPPPIPPTESGSGSGSGSGVSPPIPTGSGGGSSNGDCKCGLAQRRTRIVGGVEAEVNEWPWQVEFLLKTISWTSNLPRLAWFLTEVASSGAGGW